jgi:hypothetical protein
MSYDLTATSKTNNAAYDVSATQWNLNKNHVNGETPSHQHPLNFFLRFKPSDATVYEAINGVTGKVVYTDTSANQSTVANQALTAAAAAGGGKIVVDNKATHTWVNVGLDEAYDTDVNIEVCGLKGATIQAGSANKILVFNGCNNVYVHDLILDGRTDLYVYGFGVSEANVLQFTGCKNAYAERITAKRAFDNMVIDFYYDSPFNITFATIAIDLLKIGYGHFHDCNVSGADNDGMYIAGKVTVEGCDISTNGGNGIESNTEELFILNNTITSNGGNNINIKSCAYGGIIAFNHLDTCSWTNLAVDNSGYGVRNLKILYNRFRNSQYDAITVDNSYADPVTNPIDGVEIVGNDIATSDLDAGSYSSIAIGRSDAAMTGAITRVKIADNDINGSGVSDNVKCYGVADLKIYDNTIYGATWKGLIIANGNTVTSSKCKLRGNSISSGQDAIRIEVDGTTITDCDGKATGAFSGIALFADDCIINGGHFETTGGNTFYENAGVTGNYVTGAWFDGAYTEVSVTAINTKGYTP